MIRKIKLLSIGLAVFMTVHGQPFSKYELTKNDALFTTYAADIERTSYRWDQAYHFLFYKDNEAISFVSEQGGLLSLAFVKNSELRLNLSQMFTEPVISESYNDHVLYSFYPFRNIRVESTFLVYSSTIAIQEVRIINEGLISQQIEFLPYFARDQDIDKLRYTEAGGFEYEIFKGKDPWMKEHNIPIEEKLSNIYEIKGEIKDAFAFNNIDDFIENYNTGGNSGLKGKKLFGFNLKLNLEAGESKSYKIVRGIAPENRQEALKNEIKKLYHLDYSKILKDCKLDYTQIPDLKFENDDYRNLYWSAFSLMRQCMMPPEGECSFNYYVFSREPRWGWGFGGQVFHESLVMLAYAFMDPQSAMNSQRVFMERQWPSGYINYRTGPYLNEQIEYKGQFTSSAPWFNYQNYEVYKISGDKEFLKEAYDSGKRFYNYYVDNRDANENGLCEWGAHAVLESVRDARVAVWDRVDWPSNFESPDLNSMLVMEAKSLAKMARELSMEKEAKEWELKAQKRTELINRYLWDEDSGFYYNADKRDLDFSYLNRDDLKIMEIIGFIPLWAGVSDKDQAERLIKNMTDPEKFWRRFGIPTLSAEDEYYNPIGYWNGPIWIQWQYLIFRGLIDYGYEDIAMELAEKVLDNVVYHLKKDHTFWEFYSADDYQAGWNKTYIWTGIVARFLIDMEEMRDEGRG